jgi:hypothetical protein
MIKYDLIKNLPIFVLFFLLVGCSTDDGMPTDSNNDNQTILEPTLTASAETVRPGNFVTVRAEVNKIEVDSLEGVQIDWSLESNSETLKISHQEGGVSAVFIPSDYNENEIHITGSLGSLSQKNSSVQYGESSISVEIETDNKIPEEEVDGAIDSDTVWDEDKVYKLIRDLEIHNGATLTIKNNAVINLNGNDINSSNGSINFEGTEATPVKLIVNGGVDVPIIKANYLEAIGINDSESIDALKNLIITREDLTVTNSAIYGSVIDLRGGGEITDSHLSSAVTNNGGFTIKNSKLYAYAMNSGTGTISNNTIFRLLFRTYGTHEITNNHITYLRTQGDYDNTGIINNDIYKFFIRGTINLHQNNIGIISNSFFESGNLFFLRSPVNTNNALSQETITLVEPSDANSVQELEFTNNYWNNDIISEFKEKGTGSNISYIHDYYDESSLDKVIYKNWSEEKF